MSNNNYPPPPNPPNYQGEEQVHNVQPDLENNQEKYYAEQPQPSQQFEESFKIEKPKWNDWPFTVFFLLTVAGFIAIAGITLNALKKTYGLQGSSIYNSADTFTLNTNTIILFGFIIVVGVVLSVLIIVYARMAPRVFITTGLILNIILGLGTCIYYFVAHYYSAAIVFLVFTLFTAWCYWSCRHRIPFSATVL